MKGNMKQLWVQHKWKWFAARQWFSILFFFSVEILKKQKKNSVAFFPLTVVGSWGYVSIWLLNWKEVGASVGIASLPSKKLQQPLAVETGPCAAEAGPGMCSRHRLMAVLGDSCWHALPRAHPAVVTASTKCLLSASLTKQCRAQLLHRAGRGILLWIIITAVFIP